MHALLLLTLLAAGCSEAHGFGALFGPRRAALASVWTHVQTKVQAPTNAKKTTAGTSVNETFTSLPTVGNLVVAQVGEWDGCDQDALTTIVDNQGNAYTTLRKYNTSVTIALAYSFVATSSGTFTVTANFSGACTHTWMIAISEFSDSVAGAAAFDTSSESSGSDTVLMAGTISPTTANELFVAGGVMQVGSGPAWTCPTGYSARAKNLTDNPDLSTCSLIATNSNSQTATWGNPIASPNTYAGLQLAFKP